MHAQWTHPEIAFAVSLASQYQANPSANHMSVAESIARYLVTNKKKALVMKRVNLSLSQLKHICFGMCDADLGGCPQSKRSRAGYCFFLFGNLVGFSSKLQAHVSLSTAESEYSALSSACQFAVWYKRLIEDLGVLIDLDDPIKILCDNKSALHIAHSPVQHKYSRHIQLRLHWIKSVVRNKELAVLFTPTKDNISDIFTKPLDRNLFAKFRSKLLEGDRSPLPVEALLNITHFLDMSTYYSGDSCATRLARPFLLSDSIDSLTVHSAHYSLST